MKKKISNFIISMYITVFTFMMPALTTFAVVRANNNLLDDFSSFYDPRNTYNNVLENKSQQINGPCWAFATMATLETCLAKKGLFDKSLSEKHLLNWAHRGSNNQGWDISIQDGARFNVADGYLTSGQGPVLNGEMPYITSNGVYSYADRKLTPKYSIKGIKLVKPDANNIKKAISEYGAVSAAYMVGSRSAHAVSIVGWDDSSQRWLTKDSYGNGNSYKWYPYKNRLFSCRTFTNLERHNRNEKMYQHDEFGVIDCVKSTDSLICANVYDFGAGERLHSVMVYSESEGAKCKFYYVPLTVDGAINPNKDTWVHLRDATVPYNGYSNFELNKTFNVPKGKGAIIVELSGKDLSLGYMSKYLVGSGKAEPVLGDSYIYSVDHFEDVLKSHSLKDDAGVIAFSIKAITRK